MTTEKYQCGERIYGDTPSYGHLCGRKAVVEQDGKWYCTIHSPAYKAKKEAERNVEWHKEQAVKQASYDRIRVQQDIARGFETGQLRQHLAEIRQAIENILNGDSTR